MTQSETGLAATRAALVDLENVLRSYYAEKDKYHPSWYATLTDPVIEQIRALRAELDAVIGMPAMRHEPASGRELTDSTVS